jgi:hypothetical protein
MLPKRQLFLAALCAFGGTFFVDGPVAASEVSSTAQATDNDPRCDFGPPDSVLVAAHYKDYRSDRNHGDTTQPPQRLTETATLDDGVVVTAISDSCVDSFGYELRFTFPASSHDASDFAYWTQTTAAKLAQLQLSAEAARRLPDLTTFLLSVPSLRKGNGTVMQCRDGSQPVKNDCSFESGGLFVFDVKQRAGKTEIKLRGLNSA